MKKFFQKIKSKLNKYKEDLLYDEYEAYEQEDIVDDEYATFPYNEQESDQITEDSDFSEEEQILDTEQEYEQDQQPQEQEDEEIQDLKVDVFQTQEEIVVIAFIPGVKPSALDITISKEILEIKGRISKPFSDENVDYFEQELFWGSFKRTIMLPTEVDIDASTANEHRGVLTIKMPKFNKTRKAKIKVKSK